MSWADAVPQVLLAVLLVFGPGTVVARAARLTWLAALAVAPCASIAVLAATGALVTATDVDWSAPVGLASIAIGTAGLSLGARALTRDPHPAGERDTGDPHVDRSTMIATLAAMGTSAALIGVTMVLAIPSPNALPQGSDTFFHVDAIQLLAESGSGDPNGAGAVLWYSPLQYPGAFHSLAASVGAWSGASALVAAHATLVVLVAAAWSTGMVALMVRVVGLRGRRALVAGPLSAGVTFVPSYYLAGVLWPYAAGMALLPGVMYAVSALAVRSRDSGRRVARDLAVLALTVVAAALTHPSVLFAVALLAACMFAWGVARRGRAWAVVVVAGCVATAFVWWTGAPEHQQVAADDSLSWVVKMVLRMGALPPGIEWVLPAVTVAGLVVAAVRGHAGVALAWLAAAVLALSQNLDGRLSADHLTWPWWSGHERMFGVLTIPTLLLMSIALTRLWGVVRAQERHWLRGLGSGVVVVLVLAASASAALDNLRWVRQAYVPPEAEGWLATTAELEALAALAARLPDGTVVMGDPLTGAGFIELMGPRAVPIGPYYEKWADTRAVDERLDRVLLDDDVCALTVELGIEYVVTGGDVPPSHDEDARTRTLRRVAGDPLFPAVATAGPYTLHRMPDC